ncbi:MAG: hypothetical protein DRJ05_20725, partial [Bacteroidetes bacterium]
MIQFNFKFFIVALSIFIFTESFSQPVITIDPNNPTSVEKYDMIEIAFDIVFYGDPPQPNYYDPEEVDVYCVFTNTETGTTEQVNAFYYIGYDRSSYPNPGVPKPWNFIETLTETTANKGWRIRFSPEIETYENDDNWTFSITAINHNAGTTATTGDYSFKCTPSDRKGFIGISQSNNRYFEYSNGGNYMPIGQNVGWYYWKGAVKDNESLGDMDEPFGTYEYDCYIEELNNNQANYFRNWIGHYRSLSITPCWDYEENKFFYNEINQKDAWRMDYIVEETGNSSPRINIMPCFFTHQVFKGEGWNQQWETGFNPYSIASGEGTCTNPWDFFTNEDAKQVTKNAFRYIVARWGYATNILSWELFNEVDKLLYDVPGFPDGTNLHQIKVWHQDMYEYITEDLGDNHLVSTSFSGLATTTNFDIVADEMDFVQSHRYWDANDDKINKRSFVLAENHLEDFHEVPYLFGETGFFSHTSSGSENDPHGYQNHCMNFASLFTGAVGATAYWWWRDAYTHNYAQHYKPVSEFASNLELFHDSYSYTYVVQEPPDPNPEPDPDYNQVTHLTYMVSENNEFVAGWGQDDDFEFNSLLLDSNTLYLNTFLNVNPDNRPDYFENRNITIDGLKQGYYKLRWFNTEDGTEIESQANLVNVVGSTVDITVPPHYFDTPYGDFLFIMDYIDADIAFWKHPYVFYQNKEQNGSFTPEIDRVVVQWQLTEPKGCIFDWGLDESYGLPGE